jgi:L-ascorbate metabolism protein UlaG (beta-lactamase superfamily)
MKIIWLGHASFKIEIAQKVLLIDPWLTGNPILPEEKHAEAIQGATHILLTHAHFDHICDTLPIAKDKNIPIVGQVDLISHWVKTEAIEGIGFNKGGTVMLGDVAVTMVHAVHSSTISGQDGPRCVGSECGFMISGEGHTIYISGDTDVMADMQIFNDLHAPDIGILSAGGHFTMDMKRAGYAAAKFFDFETIIPCHYKTFPLLEQSADNLIKAVPNARVIEPELLVPVHI